MTAIVYTDASYCDANDIAACGYIVLVNGKMVKHDVVMVAGLKTPTNAEMFAIVKGVQFSFLMKGVNSILVNTDCKSIVDLKENGNSRGKIDTKEFDETIEVLREHGVNCTLFFVRGHRNNFFNNKIDLSCISHLREYLNKHTNKKK